VAGKKKSQSRECEVAGLKHLLKLLPLLDPLQDVSCARDRAGYRPRHFEKHCLLVLLSLLSSVSTSLGGSSQTGKLQKVGRLLGCAPVSLGSLSEPASVFVAQRLEEMIEKLGGPLQPLTCEPRLQGISQTLALVEATLVSALPRIMHVCGWKGSDQSGMVTWRLHTHFDVMRHLPDQIEVTPNGGGDPNERVIHRRMIQSDRLDVMDRGDAKFTLFVR